MGNFDHISREQNPYFDFGSDKYQAERDMLSVTINEYYNKYGVCMEFYVVSYDTQYDKIFGEDNNRTCERYFNFNGYFNLPREDKIWTKFGIEGMTDIIVWVSKRHFNGASSQQGNKSYIPQIGDIVKTEYSKYFYEITEVAEDTGLFLQSNQYIWEFHLRPMKNEHISISEEVADSDFARVTSLDDLFNISTDIDIQKDEILYEPKDNEKPHNDPFGSW